MSTIIFLDHRASELARIQYAYCIWRGPITAGSEGLDYFSIH